MDTLRLVQPVREWRDLKRGSAPRRSARQARHLESTGTLWTGAWAGAQLQR